MSDNLTAEFFDGRVGVLPNCPSPLTENWDYQEDNSVLASWFFLRLKIHIISRINSMRCWKKFSSPVHAPGCESLALIWPFSGPGLLVAIRTDGGSRISAASSMLNLLSAELDKCCLSQQKRKQTARAGRKRLEKFPLWVVSGLDQAITGNFKLICQVSGLFFTLLRQQKQIKVKTEIKVWWFSLLTCSLWTSA